MDLLSETSRLLGLLALLASFGILVTRQAQPVAYAVQLGLVGATVLCQALLQGDGGLVAVAVLVVGQVLLLRLLPRAGMGHPAFPAATVCGGLLLVVLATASAPAEGMGVPLAIMLLGLLGAATMPGRFGMLSLLNGAVLGLAVAPGLPLRPVSTLVLVGLAGLLVTDGRVSWVRR